MNIFVKYEIQVEKIARDIQGPALALVLERLRPNGSFQGELDWYIHISVFHGFLYTHFFFFFQNLLNLPRQMQPAPQNPYPKRENRHLMVFRSMEVKLCLRYVLIR